MSDNIPTLDQPQRISINGKDVATTDADVTANAAADAANYAARIQWNQRGVLRAGKCPHRTADIVQAKNGSGAIVGRNEPCPWHPAHKFKRCPHDCYRNGPPEVFSKPGQPNAEQA